MSKLAEQTHSTPPQGSSAARPEMRQAFSERRLSEDIFPKPQHKVTCAEDHGRFQPFAAGLMAILVCEALKASSQHGMLSGSHSMNLQGARARQHLVSDAKARRHSLTSTEDLPANLSQRQVPKGAPGLQLDVHKLAHGALMWAQVGCM